MTPFSFCRGEVSPSRSPLLLLFILCRRMGVPILLPSGSALFSLFPSQLPYGVGSFFVGCWFPSSNAGMGWAGLLGCFGLMWVSASSYWLFAWWIVALAFSGSTPSIVLLLRFLLTTHHTMHTHLPCVLTSPMCAYTYMVTFPICIHPYIPITTSCPITLTGVGTISFDYERNDHG